MGAVVYDPEALSECSALVVSFFFCSDVGLVVLLEIQSNPLDSDNSHSFSQSLPITVEACDATPCKTAEKNLALEYVRRRLWNATPFLSLQLATTGESGSPAEVVHD